MRIPYGSLTTGFVRKRALSPRRLQGTSGSFMSASKQGSAPRAATLEESRCRTLTLRDMAKDAFLVPESVPDGAELNRPEPTGDDGGRRVRPDRTAFHPPPKPGVAGSSPAAPVAQNKPKPAQLGGFRCLKARSRPTALDGVGFENSVVSDLQGN